MILSRKFQLSLVLLVTSLVLLTEKHLHAQSGMPTQAYLDRFQIKRDWWGTASIDGTRDRVKFMTLSEKNLYVQSGTGTVTAFDALSGEKRWTSQIGNDRGSCSRVVELGELVLVNSGTTLFAIQKADGNVRWKTTLGFSPSASPAGFGDRLFFPTNHGVLYAIDVAKLNELHLAGNLAEAHGRAILWKFITSNPINLSPVATESYVCFVGADGTVYSITAVSHELRFRFEARSPLIAPLVMAKDSFLVTAQNFHIYNINQATGQVKWEFVSGPRVSRAPVVIDQEVFLAPDHANLYCLDLKRGRKIWESSGAVEFVSASDKRVYASDRLQNLIVLNRKDGSLEHKVGLQQFKHRVGNDHTDRAYLSTDDGIVITLRDHDLEKAIIHPSQYPAPDKKPGETQPPATSPEKAAATPSSEPPATTETPATEAKEPAETSTTESPAASESEKPADTTPDQPAETPQ